MIRRPATTLSPAPAPTRALSSVQRATPPPRAERWLAFLRIAVGLWFLKSLFTKLQPELAGGVLPVLAPTDRWLAFIPERLAEYAAGEPIEAYRWFLESVAVPNASLFAHLTAWAESAVGVGLTLGAFTRAFAGLGLFLMLNYLLASFWMGPSQQGFHLVLIACMCAFIGARAGRTWGLDGRLARTRSRLAQRLT